MKNDTTTTCLGIVLALVITLIVGNLMRGWALSTIWNWFIPATLGLTSLTLWQALGISFVFQLFVGTNDVQRAQSDTKNKTFGEVFLESVLVSTLSPILYVCVAYILYQLAF